MILASSVLFSFASASADCTPSLPFVPKTVSCKDLSQTNDTEINILPAEGTACGYFATVFTTQPLHFNRSYFVQVTYSGDYFNFDDASGEFHLLTAGVPQGLNNFQVSLPNVPVPILHSDSDTLFSCTVAH
jgi:hypothetical protein